MKSSAVWRFTRSIAAGSQIAMFAGVPALAAQSQIVSAVELHQELLAATRTRQQNSDTIHRLLDSAPAKKLGASQLERVKAAVASLNDSELARLATRAEKAQADFAAGRISDRDLLLILVGLVALILIIVAVG